MSDQEGPRVERFNTDAKEGYILRPEGPCDLESTLCGGQAFRWKKMDGCYQGVVLGKQLRLSQEGDSVFLEGAESEHDAIFIAKYLALDLDQGAIERELESTDDVMRRAVAASSGLRTLRQEPWETLIAFIISANNGVPNISRVMENLAEMYGDRAEGPFGSFSKFPSPDQLVDAGHEGVWACKAGFRTKGICEAARGVLEGYVDLESIASMDYPEAKQELLMLHGIGEKVADCILLFSMGKYEAFPVDVWIERIVRHLYFDDGKVSHKQIRRWAEAAFGNLAGFANQFLFNYGRKFIAKQLRKESVAGS
ncbi:MAG TPA: DNA glycosylase [Bacillota bacterium]|nr:DNA glycosylase [Bacillota bacterium]HOH10156.1 DNA glycosylase [Bacillota bacterium]HPI02145.1 DNA glycosylase [Bacillota bacterium]HPM64100.1 DNA glycosylase [Bacillota bacterium]